MKRFFLVISLFAFALSQAAKAEGYNNESHVYLAIDGVTKYYKVSTEGWTVGAVLPGTWGGNLWDQDFGIVNSIVIKGGAVGGWTNNGEWLYGLLSYKVYPVGAMEPADWTDFGDVANQGFSNVYNSNNCFWYKDDGKQAINIASLAPGRYYLKIQVRCGGSDQYSAAKFTVPAVTIQDNHQHDWVLRFQKFAIGQNVKMLRVEPVDATAHSGCELTIPNGFELNNTQYTITSSNSNIIKDVAGLTKVTLPSSVTQMNANDQVIDMTNAQPYTYTGEASNIVDAHNGKKVLVSPKISCTQEWIFTGNFSVGEATSYSKWGCALLASGDNPLAGSWKDGFQVWINGREHSQPNGNIGIVTNGTSGSVFYFKDANNAVINVLNKTVTFSIHNHPTGKVDFTVKAVAADGGSQEGTLSFTYKLDSISWLSMAIPSTVTCNRLAFQMIEAGGDGASGETASSLALFNGCPDLNRVVLSQSQSRIYESTEYGLIYEKSSAPMLLRCLEGVTSASLYEETFAIVEGAFFNSKPMTVSLPASVNTFIGSATNSNSQVTLVVNPMQYLRMTEIDQQHSLIYLDRFAPAAWENNDVFVSFSAPLLLSRDEVKEIFTELRYVKQLAVNNGTLQVIYSGNICDDNSGEQLFNDGKIYGYIGKLNLDSRNKDMRFEPRNLLEQTDTHEVSVTDNGVTYTIGLVPNMERVTINGVEGDQIFHSNYILNASGQWVRVPAGRSTFANPYRAYLTIRTSGTPTGPAPARVVFQTEDTQVATMLDHLTSYQTRGVYTMLGTYLGEDESVLENLPAGVYVVNGGKVVKK